MWTDAEYEALEEMQHELTLEEFVLIAALLEQCTSEVRKEIISFYDTYGTKGIVSYATSRKRVSLRNRQKRVALLYSTIDKLFSGYQSKVATLFSKSLIKMIKTEEDFFGVTLDKEKLMKTKWGEDNLNWEKRLDNQIKKQKYKIKSRLKIGFNRQDYITDITDELIDEFKTFRKQLWGLYETEINATTSLARLEVLSELGYKKYQYYARLDERTCGTCGHMHGTKFPMSQFQIGVTAPPMHPHCRCWITNIRE